jgi:hypothetical protein
VKELKINRVFRKRILTVLFISVPGTVFAVPCNLKAVQIKQANSPVRIDAVLDEDDWIQAEVATDFHVNGK